MSSVIFQPLLHDPLGWKSSNSTYNDHFQWRKYRSTNKDKKLSTYGQQYQKQQQKQQKLQQINICLPPATNNEEQTIQRVSPVNKNEDKRGPSASYRYSPSKTPPIAAVEESPVLIVEYKQRPVSTNREAACRSRASQRSPPAVEEIRRPATSIESRRSQRDEKEKVTVDPDNDNSRHWLTFPIVKTPQYLIDVKQRLGQLKVPSTPARPTSVLDRPAEEKPVDRSDSSSHRRQQSADQRHFLDFNLSETPDELRAARHRLEKHRYNSSIDNYPARPKTSPVHINDISKAVTPPIPSESEDEQITPAKDDAWIPDEENQTPDYESPSIMVQMIDVDGLPNEYVEALETANIAQEEYIRSLKIPNEKRPDNPVHRLPPMPSDTKTESFIAYRNQQQQSPSLNNSSRRNGFGSWVRNATDKERESAIKILQDVLNQPVMGYDIPTKQQTVFKQPPAPPPVRTTSATRKLGRTRTHQQIPCEICEKELIKHHVWNLSRSDVMTCSHQAQGNKPPIIQVRS